MEQAAPTNHQATGFGKNSTGLGVFLIAFTAVLLGLIGWNFWNNDAAENDHYRLPEKTSQQTNAHGAAHSSVDTSKAHNHSTSTPAPKEDSTASHAH